MGTDHALLEVDLESSTAFLPNSLYLPCATLDWRLELQYVADISTPFAVLTKSTDRYEKRHKNLAAHVSPAFRVELGDTVTVGQCRPLSKTVRFNVLRVSKNKAAAKAFGKF